MKKAKYGKMRQVTAVNGSKMVVKIRVVYYRGFLRKYTTLRRIRQQHKRRGKMPLPCSSRSKCSIPFEENDWS